MIPKIKTKKELKEKLTKAIHKKHKPYRLNTVSVEKNVDRFFQLSHGTLYCDIIRNFEFIKHLIDTPTFETTRITEEMRESFWHEDWSMTTNSFLSNAMSVTLIGLRKIIEKTNKEGNPQKEFRKHFINNSCDKEI